MVPGPSRRGLSLSPSWGVQGQGGRLWAAAPGALAGDRSGAQSGAGLDTELGYSLRCWTDGLMGTPYAGLGLIEAGTRYYRLDWRRGDPQRGGERQRDPEHGVMLLRSLRW